MFCSNCGGQISTGLSFCNRCGFSLREPDSKHTGAITAFLTAITIIGIVGLGIMLGGALVLRKEAGMDEDLIVIFMLFTLLLIGTSEIMLMRQLSRLTSAGSKVKLPEGRAESAPAQLRAPQVAALGEPAASVTENTTRTLEYARLHNDDKKEPRR